MKVGDRVFVTQNCVDVSGSVDHHANKFCIIYEIHPTKEYCRVKLEDESISELGGNWNRTDLLIVEEIYNSPLYKALSEDGSLDENSPLYKALQED